MGAGTSAVLGFAFNIILARELGAFGAGVVLQSVAVFTIAVALARAGLDTTAVWLLPRLVGRDPKQTRSALVALLVPAAALPLLITLGWLSMRALFPDWAAASPVMDAVSLVVLFLPAASVMIVALAATRAFGGVLPFNLIGNILVPSLRVAGLIVVVAVGGGALAAAASWAVPWAIGAALALVIVARMQRRATRGTEAHWRPAPSMRREIRRYSLPRMVMASMEQAIIWVDVIIVGVLLTSVEAGVYGSAARFVAAGIVVITALRIVVAPRFSALLAEQRTAEVKELYSVTARWILIFGAPIYILLAVFAPTILRWLGEGFESGITSMVILSLGSIVVVAAGNVQSLLLMSGRSGWGAVNKFVVVCFNVLGNLMFVPVFGIEAAAAVWAASMLLDTTLAAWQVRRGTGISLDFVSVALGALTVGLCAGVPALGVALLLGQGTWQLLLAGCVSGLVLLGYAVLDRRRLRFDQLFARGAVR